MEKRKTLLNQVRTGSRRASLEALRDKVAETIDSTESGRDIAALSKRLIEIMSEIDSLPVEGEAGSPLEAAREAAKR